MDTEIDSVLRGDKKAIAKILNVFEETGSSRLEWHRKLVDELSRNAKPERHVVGITGPPGAGKSTVVSRLVSEYRSREKTVGVIAVDPSSKRSGGALLGDRSRIAYDPDDAGIFIRSMAAGTHVGGLAWRTRHCLTVFEAVYDIVLVETVGVGQSETEVDQVADTVVFIAQPGSGDLLQFIKAGIMEIPHVIVVNKADQQTLAVKARNDLMAARAYSPAALGGWDLRVIMTSALKGWGHEELVDILEDHRRFLSESGMIEDLRLQHRLEWVNMLFRERFGSFGFDALGGEDKVQKIIAQEKTNNPFEILKALTREILGKIRSGGIRLN